MIPNSTTFPFPLAFRPCSTNVALHATNLHIFGQPLLIWTLYIEIREISEISEIRDTSRSLSLWRSNSYFVWIIFCDSVKMRCRSLIASWGSSSSWSYPEILEIGPPLLASYVRTCLCILSSFCQHFRKSHSIKISIKVRCKMHT